MPGRWIGVDFGTVRVGLASEDPGTGIAFPLQTYTRAAPAKDAGFFQELAKREQVAGWVVGLPVRGDGSEGEKAKEAREFGQWLGKTTGVEVRFFDERYTTVEAEETLKAVGMSPKKRKEKRDQIAAQIILQSFLESGGAGLDDIPPGPLST
ncbi:MAG: Holliday junction resolvase RuvX [Gemmataceae bacterium]|nr:Holliday junction resolvase RuvX [Gemmataceae bacterium]